MPVSLGAFVCRMPAQYDHLKLAKTAWLPLSFHGVKDASQSKLNSSVGSLFFFLPHSFCLYNLILHQQVCYSSSQTQGLFLFLDLS